MNIIWARLFALALLVQLDTTDSLWAADDCTTGVMAMQNPQQVFTTPDYTGGFTERSSFSGDWGSARQVLANKGLTLDMNLTQLVQGVTAGGIKTGSEYMGRGETTLNLDTAKLGLWPGGLFTVMGEGNFGNPLNANTGTLLGVNANEFFPETENSFLLPQVTFTQFLSPKFGIALGKLATISETGGDMNEFAHGKGSQQFVNPVLNFTPIIALTVPYSTLGASAIFLPVENLTLAASVLDSHGTADSDGFDKLFQDGATFALEGRYATRFFSKTGHQLMGATYSSSNYVELDQRTVNLIIPGLPVEQADNAWAVYWNGDQYFYQPNPQMDRGIGIFARYGLSDGIANPIHNFASFGLGGKGMIPGRDNDGFGLGYFYIWSANTRITNQTGFEDSQGFEGFYQIALTPALRLSPDIQWIQPSQKRVDSSWVVGVRLYTVF